VVGDQGTRGVSSHVVGGHLELPPYCGVCVVLGDEVVEEADQAVRQQDHGGHGRGLGRVTGVRH